MSKYQDNRRENRFKNLTIVRKYGPYIVGEYLLIIYKPTGCPFCGKITAIQSDWDINGKLVVKYEVFIHQVGIKVKAGDERWETSTLGYF